MSTGLALVIAGLILWGILGIARQVRALGRSLDAPTRRLVGQRFVLHDPAMDEDAQVAVLDEAFYGPDSDGNPYVPAAS